MFVINFSGIRQKIDHLHYLHIDILLLSSICDSPMVDQGRDVSDFTNINPKFGTMEDFTQLVDELHQLGRILLIRANN
jgi:glycosidase